MLMQLGWGASMMKNNFRWPGLILIFSIIFSLLPVSMISAQSPDSNRAIDLMLLIDNSCSMFPANRLLPSCESFGSDPDYLRIVGADLFAARLGFGAANEDQYQVGVIGFGSTTTEIIPLQPLKDMRDEIAKNIANPKPEEATKIVPALDLAYRQLQNSPNRHKNNLPAMVVITDGVPWPETDQSQTDLENLIDANQNIPLFLMLLQNPQSASEDYQAYIEFWKKLESRSDNLFVYLIQSADQIEATYNSIIAQLQNTIPSTSSALTAGKKVNFYVSDYVQKVIITIIRKNTLSNVKYSILDPQGIAIKTSEDGVGYFHGVQNPVDVISIAAPRLSGDVKEKTWTVTADSNVTVLVDREGSYQIAIIDPTTAPTDVINVHQVVERLNPTVSLDIRFNLVSNEQRIITDPQVIRADAIDPSGRQTSLAGAINLKPGPDGVYNLHFDPTLIYPDITKTPGRFVILLYAGLSDLENPDSPPIASSRLILNMGRIPYIRSIAPSPLVCAPGWQSDIRVGMGDFDAVQTDGGLKVKVVSGEQTLELMAKEDGVYYGNLIEICQTLLSQTMCSASQNAFVRVQVSGYGLDGQLLPETSKDAQVQINPASCTPTPIPSATPMPTPIPTPVPDSDRDGINNALDRCPSIVGLGSPTGCPRAGTVLLLILAVVLLILGRWLLWPWLKVRSVAQPPHAYLTAIRDGKTILEPIDLYEMGIKRRLSRIRIGSDPLRSEIVLEGLRGVEYVIEKYKFNDSVRDAHEKVPFLYIEETPRTFRTSDPRVLLVISRNLQTLTPDQKS